MEELIVLIKQLWLVWFLIVFAGISAWAFWPSRRREMEDQANIPLRDEDFPSAHGAR